MAPKKTSTVKSKAPKKAASKKSTPVWAARKVQSAALKAPAKVQSAAAEATRVTQSIAKSAANMKYNEAFSTAKQQIEKVGTQLFSGFEGVSQIGKDNVEAVVKSSQILAKSAEQLGRAIAGFTQSSLEIGAQAGQALLGVKTLRDLVEVQSEFARNSFDHFVAGTSKISDMTVKVANEALEPINQCMNESIDKATKKFAA